jgi:hypothetical protein
VWWISFRGEGRHGLDNIGVFNDDGSVRTPHPLLLDAAPKAQPLHIPRGFALVGDELYIASAWRGDSHIARYRRRGNRFHFVDNPVTTASAAAMVHPFDVELGDDGRLYISCQDSNTVIALQPKTRQPAPVAPHLREAFPQGRFLPGTVVASARGRLPEVAQTSPTDVPPPLGLEVVLDVHGKPRHSVRGIIVHESLLYVADEAGDAVKVFDVASGRLLARIEGKRLLKPVHLVLRGQTLYIGAAGSGSILAYDIPETAPAGKLKARCVIDGRLKAPSGFAFGPEGDIYVAERFDQRVRRFTPDGRKIGTFIEGLPDIPEFLVYVPERGVRAPRARVAGDVTRRARRRA